MCRNLFLAQLQQLFFAYGVEDFLQTVGGNGTLIDNGFIGENALKMITPVRLQQDADIFSLGDMLQTENIRIVTAVGVAPRQE